MFRLNAMVAALCLGLWLAVSAAPLHAQAAGTFEAPTIAELEQSCSAGNAADCDVLGMRHLTGDGTAKDPKKAAAFFQRACDRGDALGCFNLGESYQFGDGVPKDPAKAAGFYQRACDGRDPRGCADLALSYIDGQGVGKSDAQAALYADRACALKNPLGCAILGAVYAEGVEGYPKDVERAGDLLFDACHEDTKYTEKPDQAARLACPAYTKLTGKPACLTLSVFGSPTGEVRKHCFDAQAGWVTTVTQNAPLPIAKAAVPAPAAPPPANVALSAGNAAHARKDYAAAAGQFAKACDAGSVEACGMLGEMYVTGQGVAANGKLAAPLLAKACDAGSATSCDALSAIYARGLGVKVNYATAETLKKKSMRLDPGFTSKIPTYLRLGEDTPVKTFSWDKISTEGLSGNSNISSFIDQFLIRDSVYWIKSKYDVGSVKNVMIYPSASGDRYFYFGAEFTLDGGTDWWITARVDQGDIRCVTSKGDQFVCREPYTPENQKPGFFNYLIDNFLGSPSGSSSNNPDCGTFQVGTDDRGYPVYGQKCR